MLIEIRIDRLISITIEAQATAFTNDEQEKVVQVNSAVLKNYSCPDSVLPTTLDAVVDSIDASLAEALTTEEDSYTHRAASEAQTTNSPDVGNQ